MTPDEIAADARQRLLRVARSRIILDPALDAEDLVQDAYLRWVKARPRFIDGPSLVAYLVTAVYSASISRNRPKGKTTTVSLDERHPDPAAETADRVEREMRLDEVLALADDLGGRTISVIKFLGYTKYEIARAWHIQPSTVNTRQNRWRQDHVAEGSST